MVPLNILGLEGNKGSGKDTLCEILIKESPILVKRFAFGDSVKTEVNKIFNIPMRLLHADEETKNSTLTSISRADMHLAGYAYHDGCADFKHLTVREVLQFWGTEVRRSQDPNYWLYQMEKDIIEFSDSNPDSIAVITDVRFDNEVALVLKLGGYLVKILSEDVKDNHISENCKLYHDYEIPGRSLASKAESYSQLNNVMWSAFGINCRSK